MPPSLLERIRWSLDPIRSSLRNSGGCVSAMRTKSFTSSAYICSHLNRLRIRIKQARNCLHAVRQFSSGADAVGATLHLRTPAAS